MKLKDYLNSILATDTVVVLGKKIDGFDNSHSGETIDSVEFNVSGVEVQSWLFTYDTFKNMNPEILIWCLSRVRGEGVEDQKSKIGIIYTIDDEDYINWF